ncbi:D(1)-like dopamine receptor [Haliotis cracherodii]|uniref:uncharacterized protein LOC124134206 n=1 Tax=Haliotis rufescens TaxID=6454 RepID=UPI00201F7409|nr:uncharacterized protein LOC124134206 [Haliotis rufescens]
MQMTGESRLEWAETSGAEEARRQDRYGGNFSIPQFKPWGAQGAVATVSVIFTFWIVLANAFLIAVILTSRYLRKQRPTLYVVQIAIADLAVGVFYCPLAADFYLKQVWTHGCESLFIWNTFLYYTTFISVHALGLINLNRLLGHCCRLRFGPKLKLAINLTLILLLWFYLVFFGQSVQNFRATEAVIVHPNLFCHADISYTGALASSLLGFFVPAVLTVIFLVIIIIKEKFSHPTHHELNRIEDKVFSLKVLCGANAITLVMSLPCFVLIVGLSLGSCGSLECIHWILPVTTVFEWLLFAKSGIQPAIWLINPDYKTAMLPVVRFIRRQPGMDTTELVEADDNSDEDEPPNEGSDNRAHKPQCAEEAPAGAGYGTSC